MDSHRIDGRAKLAFLLTAAALSGCQNFGDEPKHLPVNTAKSAEQVGEVNIDIVSIDQFRDVKARFDTKYGLTAQDALKAVNQASSFESLASIRSTTLGASIEADGTLLSNDATKTTTSNTAADGTVATTTAATTTSDHKTTTPASAPTIGQSPGAPASASAFGTSIPALAPMLGLQASDALYKYGAVLDGGVGQIAPCGYDPILVTLRVSIIPHQRSQPYDTYLDLSVLPGELDKKNQNANAKVPALTDEEYRTSRSQTKGTGSFYDRKASFGNATSGPESDTPDIHDPLKCGYNVPPDDLNIVSFSSDSLENTQSDLVAQQTKALILAAALRAGTVAASASYQNLAEELDHTLSLRPNSLLSVGRTGKNTLHIRLGANRFGSTDYEMLPLEHNITVVILVPHQWVDPVTGGEENQKSGKPLTALGHYYFKDARGKDDDNTINPNDALPDTDPASEAARNRYLQNVAAAVMDQFQTPGYSFLQVCAKGVVPAKECAPLSSLAYYIPNNTLSSFKDKLKTTKELPPPSYSAESAQASQTPPLSNTAASNDDERWKLSDDADAIALELWQRLTVVSARPGLTPRVSRNIPQTLRRCALPFAIADAVDDGTDLTVSVNGFDNFAGQTITATLDLYTSTKNDIGFPKKGKTYSSTFVVPANDIGDLKFHSVASYFGTEKSNVQGEIRIAGQDGLYCPGAGSFYRIAYSQGKPKADASKPDAKKTGLSNTVSQVTETSGSATAPFTITLADVKANAAILTVASGIGAVTSIQGQGGTVVPVTGGKAKITASGDYTAVLANLAPGKKLTLKIQFQAAGKDLKDAAPTYALDVVKG